MQTNPVVRALRYIGLEFVWGILYFPVWWYSAGLKKMFIFIKNEVLSFAATLNLKILFKSLFKPMYGDYSREGRIISIFVRFFHFLFLFIAELVLIVVLLIVFLAWLLLPLIVAYFIFFQFSNYPENHIFSLINAVR